jgi:hypothetical protein
MTSPLLVCETLSGRKSTRLRRNAAHCAMQETGYVANSKDRMDGRSRKAHTHVQTSEAGNPCRRSERKKTSSTVKAVTDSATASAGQRTAEWLSMEAHGRWGRRRRTNKSKHKWELQEILQSPYVKTGIKQRALKAPRKCRVR